MSRTSPGRRRTARGDRDRRREEIPRTAMEVFAARGSDRAFPAQAPDRVGPARAGVLRRLPPGADLLTRVPDPCDDTSPAPAPGRPVGAEPFAGEGEP